MVTLNTGTAASAKTGKAGAAGAIGTSNSATAMGAAAVAGVDLTTSDTGTTSTTNTTDAMVDAVTANSTCAANTNDAGVKEKEKNQETQANIILISPTTTLANELHKTLFDKKIHLTAQLHTFLLREPPDLNQLNDPENKPVVGTINTPKSSTIRVLHFFGVGTNPIRGSSPPLETSSPLQAMGPMIKHLRPRYPQGRYSTRPPSRYSPRKPLVARLSITQSLPSSRTQTPTMKR